MIKTTKTTYCPKKLITNNYLLTIRRTCPSEVNRDGKQQKVIYSNNNNSILRSSDFGS